MSKILNLILLLSLSLGLLGLLSPAFALSGHTVWGAWRFDWEVWDNSGLVLRHVFYDNERVFWKAGLPVIRVQYAGNVCGPYADQISSGTVYQRSFTASDGRNWLEIGIYTTIGAYHIYQAWYLSDDGWIAPRVWSRGLQCPVDHDHHSYWRMDFDINGYPSDQVFVYDNNRPDVGWGPGWHKYTNETNDAKNIATDRVWFVRDNPTGHGVWIIPGPDGAANSFSNKDVGARRYHGSEDEPWPFGAWGHLGYNNGEDIGEEDIVFWYVAHMHHEQEEGSGQWEWHGPWLFLER